LKKELSASNDTNKHKEQNIKDLKQIIEHKEKASIKNETDISNLTAANK